MKIVQREDPVTKETMYSADIHCKSNLWGKFTIPMLDVRDGGIEEVVVLDKDEKPKLNKKGKPYMKLVSVGMRKEIEEFERRSGRKSKYIPEKVKIDIK
jgi:hypothetical protein